MEGVGRLKFHTQAEYVRSLDTFVRAGHHVLVDAAITLRSLIALDFSQRGTVQQGNFTVKMIVKIAITNFQCFLFLFTFFSYIGRCEFYISRDGFLPLSGVMMSQKTSPLLQGFNRRFYV